ncbi:PrgI family protein [Candidatus Saccharibacteria bacterium]|nr:PrgI family protein [Candidatus Saccharibacteria bacterium]
MATYKVPQDVEADDKLLGPFNFRQFIYLLIVAALIALAWALAQVFPLLAIFPIPPALFLLILALPLRKDQPMETYIAALIQFYTKPNKRFWNPGQRESTITIIAPKKVEQQLTKNISEEEAGRRLSFLANVVDSEGMSIKGDIAPSSSPLRAEYIAEANNATDMFENYQATQIGANLSSEADAHHAEVVEQMRAAIKATGFGSDSSNDKPFLGYNRPEEPASAPSTPTFNPDVLTNPAASAAPAIPSTPAFENLARNEDFTVATIAKEAERETSKHKSSRKAKDNEVYISLH